MENKSAKNNEPHELECIYGLIGELSREKPDSKVLKNLCAQVGIIYEANLVQLMTKVLLRASCVPQHLSTKSKKAFKAMSGEA